MFHKPFFFAFFFLLLYGRRFGCAVIFQVAKKTFYCAHGGSLFCLLLFRPGPRPRFNIVSFFGCLAKGELFYNKQEKNIDPFSEPVYAGRKYKRAKIPFVCVSNIKELIRSPVPRNWIGWCSKRLARRSKWIRPQHIQWQTAEYSTSCLATPRGTLGGGENERSSRATAVAGRRIHLCTFSAQERHLPEWAHERGFSEWELVREQQVVARARDGPPCVRCCHTRNESEATNAKSLPTLSKSTCSKIHGVPCTPVVCLVSIKKKHLPHDVNRVTNGRDQRNLHIENFLFNVSSQGHPPAVCVRHVPLERPSLSLGILCCRSR